MTQSNITLREYEHPRWGGVIHLANNEIEAILAPERGGRLLHYSRLGESNLLWTAKDMDSGLGSPGGWRNWGGEKTWLWPESEWPVRENGTRWPPPNEWEQDAFEIFKPRVGTKKEPVSANPGMEIVLANPKLRLGRIFHFPENGVRAVRRCWLIERFVTLLLLNM